MDEQELNKAAEQFASMSEDKFSNSAKKYDAYDMADAFSSGARWHEQQNPWRKVEDELPSYAKWIIVELKNVFSKNKYVTMIIKNDSEFEFVKRNVIGWKYID